jgi:hypothetical protein
LPKSTKAYARKSAYAAYTKNHDVRRTFVVRLLNIARGGKRERHDLPREREAQKKKNDFDREKQKKQNFSNRIRSFTLMEAALDGTNFGAAEAAGVVADAESPSFSARGVMLILL